VVAVKARAGWGIAQWTRVDRVVSVVSRQGMVVGRLVVSVVRVRVGLTLVGQVRESRWGSGCPPQRGAGAYGGSGG
jgi:hypothetical protein